MEGESHPLCLTATLLPHCNARPSRLDDIRGRGGGAEWTAKGQRAVPKFKTAVSTFMRTGLSKRKGAKLSELSLQIVYFARINLHGLVSLLGIPCSRNFKPVDNYFST